MNKLTKSIIILAGAIALTGCGQIHPTGYQKIPGVKQEIKEKSKSLYEKAKDKVNDFKMNILLLQIQIMMLSQIMMKQNSLICIKY